MSDQPITYTIEDPPGILHMILTGEIRGSDFIDHVDKIRDDPAYHEGLCKLVDTTTVTEFHLTRASLARYVSYKVARECVERRVAILAVNDHTYGMSRMYELLASDVHPEGAKAFRDREVAEAWLMQDQAS